MNKLYTILLLFIATYLFAQVPQGFSYQAVAFNSVGTPVANGNVGIRISILDNSDSGSVLYSETHTKTTNSKGLVNLNIGQGAPVTGAFSSINWGVNPKFIKVEMDPTGGTNYTNIGTNQLMSVPYAMVAGKATNGDGSWVKNTNDRLAYNDGDIEVAQNGSGIWLTSLSGKKFKLSVDENGKLSLPIDSAKVNVPNQLYLYGSFNNWNPNSSQLMNYKIGSKIKAFFGYKYLKAGDKFKFLTSQNPNSVIGLNGTTLVPNGGSEFTINSNGFYEIVAYSVNNKPFEVSVSLLNMKLSTYLSGSSSEDIPLSYDSSNNTFVNNSFLVNQNTNYYIIKSSQFIYALYLYTSNNLGTNGSNDGILSDQSQLPIKVMSGKNSLEVSMNFNDGGNYILNNINDGPTSVNMVFSTNSFASTTTYAMSQISPGIFKVNYPIANMKILIKGYKTVGSGTTTFTFGSNKGNSLVNVTNIPNYIDYAISPYSNYNAMIVNFNNYTYSFE